MTIREIIIYRTLTVLRVIKKVWQFLFSTVPVSPYSGRYMTKLEQMKLLSANNNGIIVNGKLRLDAETSFRHCCVIGSTGSGKSTNIYVPMILQLDAPMIILDCSGSLYKNTSGHLKSKGFHIMKLDFSDPKSSLLYNPILRATTDAKRKRLAATLVETTLGKGKDPFWNSSARQVLYVLIRCLSEIAEPKYRTIVNLRYLLNNLSHDPSSPTAKWIMAHASEELYVEYKGIMSSGEKVFSSVLATCRAALELFSDSDIAKITSHDTLGDLGKIRRKKAHVALYICVRETDISYLNSIISIILGDILDMCMDMPTKKDKDLFVLLDEFAHFTIKDFSTCLTTLRKRRVSVILATQSRSMLVHKYGKEDADAIINGGTASRVVLPGSTGHHENKALSELFGSQMVRYKNREIVKLLISQDEIYALKGEALFLHAGHRPTKLKLYPFYKNKNLLTLTQKKPVSYKRRVLPKVELIPLEIDGDRQNTDTNSMKE